MSPPFAFFPICFLFTSLGLIVGLVLLLRVGAGVDASDKDQSASPPGPRPPYWVAPIVLLAAVIVLLLLSPVTDG